MKLRKWLTAGLVAAIVAVCSPKESWANPPMPRKTIAIADGGQNFGRYRRAVSYYDATTLDATGMDNFGNVPLFSVWFGNEDAPPNFDEVSAITTNPFNGDTYAVTFDNTSFGDPNDATVDLGGDTEGDYDVYRIRYQEILDAWEADARDPNISVFDNPVTGKRGQMYGPNMDFLSSGGGMNPAHPDHDGNGFNDGTDDGGLYPAGDSRSTIATGAIEKIGEVARADGPFFDFDLEFRDPSTIIMMDNENPGPEQPSTDHELRVLKRNKTAGVVDGPGTATPTAAPGGGPPPFDEGGFNAANNSESWESIVLATVQRDFDPNSSPPGLLVGRSNPVDIAYAKKDGVEGVWLLEADGGGDDVSFFEIADFMASGTVTTKTVSDGSGGTFMDDVIDPTGGNGYATINGLGDSRALDNDPENDPNTNEGQGNFILVDSSGRVLIGESGFFDAVPGGEMGDAGPAGEPSVLRLNADTYTAGNVETTGGGGGNVWDDLTSAGLGDTPGTPPTQLEGPLGSLDNAFTGGSGLSKDDDNRVTDGRFVTLHEGGVAIDLNNDGDFDDTVNGQPERTGAALFIFDTDTDETGPDDDDDLLPGQTPEEQVTGDIYVIDLETGNIVYEEIDGVNHFLERHGIRAITRGDTNRDGVVDADDIDRLAKLDADPTDGGMFDAVDGEEYFDLTGDQLIDAQGQGDDMDELVQSILDTFYGDANLDGKVNFDDFLALQGSFGGMNGWAGGDFDGNMAVNFDDFLALQGNFGASNHAPAAAGGLGSFEAVPEPSTVALVGIGVPAFGWLLRRRRKV